MHTIATNQEVGKNVGDTERTVSIAAGAALLIFGLKQGNVAGALTAVLGGAAIHRGITGKCAVYKALNISTACERENKSEDIKIEQTVSINKPRADVYQFWRKLENLVQIMPRLKKVSLNGDGRSHWEAKGPFGSTLTWDAKIINEIDNELLAWRSLPDSELSNAGTVRFEDGGNGITHVRLSMAFTPPGGKIGEALAEILGEDPQQQLREDLDRLKLLMENKPLEAVNI